MTPHITISEEEIAQKYKSEGDQIQLLKISEVFIFKDSTWFDNHIKRVCLNIHKSAIHLQNFFHVLLYRMVGAGFCHKTRFKYDIQM